MKEADKDTLIEALEEQAIELLLAFQECTDERDAMVDLLQKCEWEMKNDYGERHCPICEEWVGDGHAPGCAMQELLHRG